MLVHHSSADYKTAASEAATEARGKMEALIERGRASALQVVEHINTNVPTDHLVRGRAMRFGFSSQVAFRPAPEAAYLGDPSLEGQVDADGIPLQVAALLNGAGTPAPTDDIEPSSLVLEIAENTKETIHKHALTQIAGRASIPLKYLKELLESDHPPLRALGLELLNTHYGKTHLATNNFLARSVNGELRGFLSDQFKRLDNRPLLEAFAQGCANVGAIPVEGTASDVRIQMKAYLPMVFEPIPDEVMLIGLAWGNSDFGAAAHTLSLTLLRLWCTNRCTVENSLRDVHLGRRLDKGINYSERTYKLDTDATAAALHDTVSDLLGPRRVNTVLDAIKQAGDQPATWSKLPPKVLALMNKAEQTLGKEMFSEDSDIMRLPTEKSVWRASNVLSWIAGRVEDADRRLDLERAAGSLLDRTIKRATA